MARLPTFRTLARASIALVLVGAIVSPFAAGQAGATPDLQLTASSVGIVPPDREPGSVQFTWTYSVDQGYNVVGNANPTGILTLGLDGCPTGVEIVGSQTVLVDLSDAFTQSNQATATTASYDVIVTRQAPGLIALKCSVTGKIGAVQSPSIPESNQATAPVTVTADYFPLLQAKLANKLIQQAPQKQVQFPIEVSNFGNAQTIVDFGLEVQPEAGEWNPLLPNQLLLDSPTSGGETTVGTETFEVTAPSKNGWNNVEGSFTLTLKPVAATATDKEGLPIKISVLARSRGVYVPGFEAVFMVGGLLGLALLARQRSLE